MTKTSQKDVAIMKKNRAPQYRRLPPMWGTGGGSDVCSLNPACGFKPVEATFTVEPGDTIIVKPRSPVKVAPGSPFRSLL